MATWWRPWLKPANVVGEVHARSAPRSVEHVNEVVSSEARKLNAAAVDPLTRTGSARASCSSEPGPPVMIVFGGFSSSKSVASNGLGVLGPVSATTRRLPARGGWNELCVAHASLVKPQWISSMEPLLPKPNALPAEVRASSDDAPRHSPPSGTHADPPAPPEASMNE